MPNKSSSFVLSEELDVLTFDFSSVGGAKGVIPEPSSVQITTFQRDLRHAMAPSLAIMKQVGSTDLTSITQETLDALDEADETAGQTMDAVADAVAALCSNSPSAEDIKKLPFRGQQVFVGWIAGKFLNPEA